MEICIAFAQLFNCICGKSRGVVGRNWDLHCICPIIQLHLRQIMGRRWLEEMEICIAFTQLFNCICGKSWGGGGGWKKWGFAVAVFRLRYHNIDRLVYQSACQKETLITMYMQISLIHFVHVYHTVHCTHSVILVGVQSQQCELTSVPCKGCMLKNWLSKEVL